MLSWEDLAKAYGRRQLFSGLCGQVDAGRGVVVSGANGAGKSTFLRILVGLVRPDRGSVERPQDRNAIGYASPHVSVYGELTGLENLRFYANVRGMVGDANASLDLLERMGLARAAGKPAATYSTGMVQRLRIACAIVHGPSLLVLDEPTIGLDQDGTAVVEQAVANHIAGNEPGALVIATNDTEQIGRLREAGWASVALGS